MVILAFLIAILIPLLCFYIIFRLDFYKTGDFRFTLTSLAAGILAYLGAYIVNTALLDSDLLTRDSIVRFAGPAIEEVLKAIVIIILVQLPRFTYFVDGAIYGFAAGMGFAIVENFQYILADVDKGVGVAIARVLSTNLIHASASATSGIVLGMMRYQRTGGKIGLAIGGLGLAFSLHSLFNNLVQMQSSLRLVFAIAIGFTAAGIIIFIIKSGLKREQAMIKKALGDADRVTHHEAAAVQQFSQGNKLQQLKQELKKRFGEKNADKIEQFLLMQARLGILRDSLEKIPDEKMRRAITQQMNGLREQMDAARREVGPYAMMHLRNTFVEKDESITGRLRAILDERASAGSQSPYEGRTVQNLMQERLDQQNPARTPQAGSGIWGSLQQKSTKTETHDKKD